ncbi:MAG: hypothetical protein H7Z38_21635 [Rubrivivax sp.]|nr:hypothetical protein [Pyrinomonadaceae bacterium]
MDGGIGTLLFFDGGAEYLIVGEAGVAEELDAPIADTAATRTFRGPKRLATPSAGRRTRGITGVGFFAHVVVLSLRMTGEVQMLFASAVEVNIGDAQNHYLGQGNKAGAIKVSWSDR